MMEQWISRGAAGTLKKLGELEAAQPSLARPEPTPGTSTSRGYRSPLAQAIARAERRKAKARGKYPRTFCESMAHKRGWCGWKGTGCGRHEMHHALQAQHYIMGPSDAVEPTSAGPAVALRFPCMPSIVRPLPSQPHHGGSGVAALASRASMYVDLIRVSLKTWPQSGALRFASPLPQASALYTAWRRLGARARCMTLAGGARARLVAPRSPSLPAVRLQSKRQNVLSLALRHKTKRCQYKL